MVEIAIMIEGQNGLNWPRWQKIALAVEELGFAGLYRSDHYTNPEPPDLDSLELWVSLTWLGSALFIPRSDFDGPDGMRRRRSFRWKAHTGSGGRLAEARAYELWLGTS